MKKKKTEQDLIKHLSDIFTEVGVESFNRDGDKTGDIQRLHTLIGMLRKGWYSPTGPLEEDSKYMLARALDKCGLGHTSYKVRTGYYYLGA